MRPTRSLERMPITRCLERRCGALLVGAAQADREESPAAGEHVEARPLLGEQERVAVDEGGHAAHREPHPRGGAREGREQRDRLEAWLGEQAAPPTHSVSKAPEASACCDSSMRSRA